MPLKSEQKLLVEKYYELLNNRRNFLRNAIVQTIQGGHSQERSRRETYKPSINANASRLSSSSRKNLKTHSQYSQVLTQRDSKKIVKREINRQMSLEKEMEECSFKPKTNKRQSKLRQQQSTILPFSEISDVNGSINELLGGRASAFYGNTNLQFDQTINCSNIE